MINDIFFQAFWEFLNLRGIFITESIDIQMDTTAEQVEEQLRTMAEFHKKVKGYDGYINKRLGNGTGKLIERYKVNLKRIKKELRRIEVNLPKNNFESLLEEKGEEYIKRGEKAIENIYKSGYVEIIGRSMNRGEICLGNTDFNNLTQKENIEIVDIYGCSYNTIEMDAIYLLRKVKKKNIAGIDYKSLSEKFCTLEEIDEKSVDFILSVLSYPHYFMKCCSRYKEKRKDWDIETYCDRLLVAMEFDNNSLI